MKKTKIFSLCMLIFASSFLVACASSNQQTMAKDLDTSVKNLVIAVSSLDWPQDGALEKFGTIQSEDSATSNVAMTDTQIDTSEIYTWLENAHSKINVLLSKRGDLLLYLNEIYGGNTSFENADLLSINVYMNIIKDNSNYLTSYNGMLENQINQALTILESNENINLINAYLIKAVETLQVRCAKIDTSVLAITSIIDIIKSNLVNDYYNYNEHITEKINDQEQEDKQTIDEKILPNDEDNTEENEASAPEQDSQTNQDTTEDNPGSVDNEQNAINFDSETKQVDQNSNDNNLTESNPTNEDKSPILDDENLANTNASNIEKDEQEKSSCIADSHATSDENNQTLSNDEFNHDDEIMTLEEPIIGDTQNKATIDKESTKMQKNAKIDTKNTKSQQKINNLHDIDKEFTVENDNIEENNAVTREIIKENMV